MLLRDGHVHWATSMGFLKQPGGTRWDVEVLAL